MGERAVRISCDRLRLVILDAGRERLPSGCTVGEGRRGRNVGSAAQTVHRLDAECFKGFSWASMNTSGVTVSEVHVEWNPSKCGQSMLPWLEGFDPARICVTRYDVAVDYPVPRWSVFDRAGRLKRVLWMDGRHVETVRLGSHDARSVLRIYDKRREERSRGECPGATSLTRVELQQRLTRNDLSFADLSKATWTMPGRVFQPTHKMRSLDTAQRCWLLSALGLGISAAYMYWKERAGTREANARLALLFEPLDPSPEAVMESEWYDALARQGLLPQPSV